MSATLAIFVWEFRFFNDVSNHCFRDGACADKVEKWRLFFSKQHVVIHQQMGSVNYFFMIAIFTVAMSIVFTAFAG